MYHITCGIALYCINLCRDDRDIEISRGFCDSQANNNGRTTSSVADNTK